MSRKLIAATAVGLDLIGAGMQVMQMVQRAQQEGRDISEEDWAQLAADRAAAFGRLDAAIERAEKREAPEAR